MPHDDVWSARPPEEWAALAATLKEITSNPRRSYVEEIHEHSKAALGIKLDSNDFGRNLEELRKWSPFTGQRPRFDGDTLKAYALDYLGCMFENERYRSGLQHQRPWKLDPRFETMRKDFIGHHPAIMPLRYWLPRYVDRKVSVMLIGDRGTGKKTLARLTGCKSQVFQSRRLVLSFPGTSVETGLSSLSGFFERHRELEGESFLHLDGMHECPEEIQRTLLNLLEENVVPPLGAGDASGPEHNAGMGPSRRLFLLSSMEPGHSHLVFPELLGWLSEVSMSVPPLNSLGGDIVVLAQAHAAKVQKGLWGKESTMGISDAGKALLLKRPWRGNVRELFGVIRQALIVHGSASGEINRRLLRRVIDSREECRHRESSASGDEFLGQEITRDWPTLDELSYRYTTRVVRDTDTYEKAAEILGIHRNTLRRILDRKS